jgi:hypothetical protein
VALQRHQSVSSLKLSKIASHLVLLTRTHTNLLSLSLTTTLQGKKNVTEKYKILSLESLQALIDILDLLNSLITKYFSSNVSVGLASGVGVGEGSGEDAIFFERSLMSSLEHVVQMASLFFSISLMFSQATGAASMVIPLILRSVPDRLLRDFSHRVS